MYLRLSIDVVITVIFVFITIFFVMDRQVWARLELITCWLGQKTANTVIPEDTFSRYVGKMLEAILSKEFFKFSEKS